MSYLDSRELQEELETITGNLNDELIKLGLCNDLDEFCEADDLYDFLKSKGDYEISGWGLEEENQFTKFLDENTIEIEEFFHLEELHAELESYGWEHGIVLIPIRDFPDYAEELVRDCGEIPENLPWYIESNIDWKGVADAVAQDYSMVTYNGEDYYYRDA